MRGDKDPRKDSIYTLDEVMSMLIDATLERNRATQMGLVLNCALLIENDLSLTPLNAWKINVSKHRHALSKVDSSEVIARLPPQGKVSMTRSGIKYKEMYYSCRQLEEENLASIARVSGGWQLDTRIDDNTVNHIYVRLNEKQGFTKCHLLPL